VWALNITSEQRTQVSLPKDDAQEMTYVPKNDARLVRIFRLLRNELFTDLCRLSGVSVMSPVLSDGILRQ
jgi:hypothetical protein